MFLTSRKWERAGEELPIEFSNWMFQILQHPVRFMYSCLNILAYPENVGELNNYAGNSKRKGREGTEGNRKDIRKIREGGQHFA